MYNSDLLYRQTAKDTGVSQVLVHSAVTHYFKTIKNAVRKLESPAYYIDFIGTIYTRKATIETEMKKLIRLYRNCKKYYHRNPVRNYKILAYVREEIGRLNRIRRILKAFYAEKKENRDNRTNKRIVATQMGYYRGTVVSAVDKAEA